MRVCLNMIVKNGAATVQKAIASVKHLINMWVIVDTGSTDGTMELVERSLVGVQGRLYSRPWVDFEHNRNEALLLAKEFTQPDDFILFMDADDVVEPKEAGLPGDVGDIGVFEIEERDCGWSFYRPFMVRAKFAARWVGKTHEYLECGGGRIVRLPTLYRVRGEKNPSQLKEKFDRDLGILEKAVTENPLDARSTFYLAQTYKEMGRLDAALRLYSLRAGLSGWEEETWWAMYEAALLKERMGMPEAEVMFSYVQAYERRPFRVEPLYQLTRFCREHGWKHVAYAHASKMVSVKKPCGEGFFLDENVYAWKALEEYGLCSYGLGFYEDARRAFSEVLRFVPDYEKNRVTSNLRFAEERCNEGLHTKDAAVGSNFVVQF